MDMIKSGFGQILLAGGTSYPTCILDFSHNNYAETQFGSTFATAGLLEQDLDAVVTKLHVASFSR
jgi:hypothetical protein